MNCEQQIKELEEEAARVAQDLLNLEIDWSKRELEYLLDASLGMPKPEYIGSIYSFSLCIVNLVMAKKTFKTKAKKDHIKYAAYWLNNFMQNKHRLLKPKA